MIGAILLTQGTPTSMYVSSQQWDFPNAWPPLQAFIIQGLDRTQHKIAQEVAAKMADTWLRTNYKGFSEKRVMFEKVYKYNTYFDPESFLGSGVSNGRVRSCNPQTNQKVSNCVFEFCYK